MRTSLTVPLWISYASRNHTRTVQHTRYTRRRIILSARTDYSKPTRKRKKNSSSWYGTNSLSLSPSARLSTIRNHIRILLSSNLFSMSLLEKQFQEFLSDSEDNLERAIEECKTENNLSKASWWWLKEDKKEELLTTFLIDYEWEERDLIWWSWRLRLAKELDEANS